ncbi:hypothetical protein Tco_0725938 [Tanacetum coccineum]|uniref:Uncharacterized protein n=1 Tax=Tanacetum coccineum TaxID=301880 RepID=A0ABQ4YGH8_9ASTR
MAAPRPSNQLARHAIDELMEFSEEIQQAHSSTNRLAQLNAMILEIEAMNDPEEFYDALFCLRDDKRVE